MTAPAPTDQPPQGAEDRGSEPACAGLDGTKGHGLQPGLALQGATHEAVERGGGEFSAGPPQAEFAPPQGAATREAVERGGHTQQPRNPLHGVTLETMVTALAEYFGWDGLGERIPVRCFNVDPSVPSSLRFLRKTPWAREKVEGLYLFMLREQRRAGPQT